MDGPLAKATEWARMSKKCEASNVGREMSRKVKVTMLAVGELRRGVIGIINPTKGWKGT